MLTGEFKHTLDSKGRVFVPAKFRADIGQNAILAKSLNKYLALYSEDEWNAFMEKLDIIAETEDIGDLKRFFMMGAVPVELDAQGRISIDADHRAYAGLEKDISFVGMRKYVEVWSAQEIGKRSEQFDIEKFRSVSKKMHLGLD